jgi:hypothetical protein
VIKWEVARKKQASFLVVRYASRELRQIVASCQEAALGSALGGGTDTILEVAGCDGEVRLISRPGQVSVDRIGDHDIATTLARISLPQPDLRATSPADHGPAESSGLLSSPGRLGGRPGRQAQLMVI